MLPVARFSELAVAVVGMTPAPTPLVAERWPDKGWVCRVSNQVPVQGCATEARISPHFGCSKLDAPTVDDVIDVFEDRVRLWLLVSCRQSNRNVMGARDHEPPAVQRAVT
jgi:hypothetical protein